jgi:hypothetical protein
MRIHQEMPPLHNSLFSLKGQNLQPLSEGFGS